MRCSAQSAPATSVCISHQATRAGGALRPTSSCATPPHSCGHEAAPLPRSMSRSFASGPRSRPRSEEHTSELQSHLNLVCRLLLEKKKKTIDEHKIAHTTRHWS